VLLNSVTCQFGDEIAIGVAGRDGRAVQQNSLRHHGRQNGLFEIAAAYSRRLRMRKKKAGGATACSCVQKPPRNRLTQVR